MEQDFVKLAKFGKIRCGYHRVKHVWRWQ